MKRGECSVAHWRVVQGEWRVMWDVDGCFTHPASRISAPHHAPRARITRHAPRATHHASRFLRNFTYAASEQHLSHHWGSSGLGAACVRRLAGAGARIIIADLKQSEGEKPVPESAACTRFVATDVTDETSVGNAIRVAQETFGAVHGAINCAGIILAERILGKDGLHSLTAFTRVLGVNLVGTFNVIRLAAAAMAQNPPSADGERGVIINTASIAAFEGQVGQAAYSASKGGVVSMTLPIARELARHGIRVVTIAPGIFDTPLLAVLSEEARRSLGEQVPFPSRLGHPDEFAALVQHIIENKMLNEPTFVLTEPWHGRQIKSLTTKHAKHTKRGEDGDRLRG